MTFELEMPRPGEYSREQVAYVAMLLDRLIQSSQGVQRVECAGGRITSDNPSLGELLDTFRAARLFDQFIMQLRSALHVDVTRQEESALILGALRAKIGGVPYDFVLKELKPPPQFVWQFIRQS